MTKPCMRCRVRHPTRLSGLSLSTCNKTKTFSTALIGNAITAAPKLGGNAMINDVPEHVSPFPVFYVPKGITAKLKVVSPLVNAK